MIVNFLAVGLIIGATHLCWWTIDHAAPFWLVVAALPLVCGIGLLFDRAWARYLWYGLASCASIGWIVATVSTALHGWPAGGAADTVIALLPGLLLVAFCVGGSFAVRQRARTIRHAR